MFLLSCRLSVEIRAIRGYFTGLLIDTSQERSPHAALNSVHDANFVGIKLFASIR